MDAARVLVVDDEASIAELVATALGYEGFEVTCAASGREALAAIAAALPDLVVLDVMLGDLDGFEVARRLLADGHRVPIVFLTARDTTPDKVEGLRLGGDDYVTKPFSLDEVVARVHAVLRRSGRVTGHLMRFADLELDDAAHEVRRAGTRIELTATEFRLLRYFLANPRQVLSRVQILEHVWGWDVEVDENVVETYVSYLRRKLDPLGPPLLRTVRGVGYVLRTEA